MGHHHWSLVIVHGWSSYMFFCKMAWKEEQGMDKMRSQGKNAMLLPLFFAPIYLLMRI